MEQNRLTLLTVRVNDQWFGIDLQHVIEVLWFVYLEELPSTRPEVLGLLTLREMTMPVVDLRILFNSRSRVYTMFTPLVAIRFEGQYVAVVVDEAYDVLEVSHEQLQPNHDSPYVEQVVQTPNRLIRLLNVHRLHAEPVSG
jgi:purine-binding chemotaxis protein CheW